MKLDKAGINLIKQFEGCSLKACKALESERYYTIGYGHYGPDVKANGKITQAQAEDLLKKDLERFERNVTKHVDVNVTQSMFNALVSLCYNIGCGAFNSSTLLKKLNAKDYSGAADQFAVWKKSGGKVIKGLVNRRAKEKTEFLRMGLKPEAKPSGKPTSKNDVPSLAKYKGHSIVEGLKSVGYDSSFASRKVLAAKLGIKSYKGTAEQNTKMLEILKNK